MKLTIAEQIALLRKRKGLSQDELAAKAGISGNTVGRIETGETSPRVDQLERLADCLDVLLVVELQAGAD